MYHPTGLSDGKSVHGSTTGRLQVLVVTLIVPTSPRLTSCLVAPSRNQHNFAGDLTVFYDYRTGVRVLKTELTRPTLVPTLKIYKGTTKGARRPRLPGTTLATQDRETFPGVGTSVESGVDVSDTVWGSFTRHNWGSHVHLGRSSDGLSSLTIAGCGHEGRFVPCPSSVLPD